MERFGEAIFKQKEEITERMMEMFSLLKELAKMNDIVIDNNVVETVKLVVNEEAIDKEEGNEPNGNVNKDSTRWGKYMDKLLKESARDVELNLFKNVLVFRKMVEFLGTIPINLKGNMWESKELIDKRIDWNRPPKEGDGAWHIRIELIDPDGEKFNKAFHSIPTTRKLSEKENPSEIIDLDHFHDSRSVTPSLAIRLVIFDKESPEVLRIFAWTILG
ncbi:hypothetical protein Tco_0322750 [Tanacetum coccineum]